MLLKKLLIAEDDDDTSYLLSSALGDSGFLCLRARNGEEALNLARTELPDAMVLDVMMPKMDGLEVCQRLKEDVLLSRIPILMLTSLAAVDDRVAGLEAGADDYLSKPFDIRELTARVKALIRQSRRERDRNPTTNLPAGEAIEERVDSLLKAGEAFCVLYIDIENFRSYADLYGYRKADEVVAHTGKLILQQARNAADPPPFVGHVGGDDFLVVCSADLALEMQTAISKAFLASVSEFYTDQDKEAGSLSFPAETGEFRQVGFMRPSIAVVTCGPGMFASVEDLALEVTKTKFKVRSRTRSGLFPLPPAFAKKD